MNQDPARGDASKSFMVSGSPFTYCTCKLSADLSQEELTRVEHTLDRKCHGLPGTAQNGSSQKNEKS